MEITLKAKLNTPFARVVQKANIGSKYTYALQMYKNDTYVSRTYNATYNGQTLNFPSPGLKMIGRTTQDINNNTHKDAAGGHTQTWEYAGGKNQNNFNGGWFIGTKSNDKKWTIQIGRLTYPGTYSKNTQISRISNLVEITNGNWSGQHIYRVEAAVSPSYHYLMIATVWTNNSGHFALYDLAKVNNALNNNGSSNVTISDLSPYKVAPYIDIDNFVGRINSIQGYDIDDSKNIYISSQYSPDKPNASERKLVKFNWQNFNNWEIHNLTKDSRLDTNFVGYPTELEGIQVIGNNDLYLTVAYHSKDGNSTIGNQIFRITW
ncbi:helveticin J family class III bacteriocin [Lactobacillus sp. LL6]|uniref:helveticin J family class III bacteriocin n=1 Tax=Lactobacillus sp. LL6 TaxID=2596827 RepID=UPI0011868A8F|nr:helveticin J family class III bacteriocin [Lactobacillus sp. LL6]TSO26932.1 bacteriocin [Lactobacillus sp. LL6]